MPVTYVDITREELEAWLTALPWRWSRDPSYKGVYYIHFSDRVGCKLSSTIGSANQTKGYAAASMKLTLVSVLDGRLLNRNAKDRDHFKRTVNWKKTWEAGIRHWLGVYQGAAAFYEKLAVITDIREYSSKLLARISAIPDWKNKDILVEFATKLERGGILTDKQEGLISNFEKETPNLTPAQVAFLQRMKALAEKARENRDPWTEQFASSLITQATKGTKPFSDPQKRLLSDKLKAYGV